MDEWPKKMRIVPAERPWQKQTRIEEVVPADLARRMAAVLEEIHDDPDKPLVWGAHLAEALARYEQEVRTARCPTCGSFDPAELYEQLDRGRAFDAGISGCPDPWHEQEVGDG